MIVRFVTEGGPSIGKLQPGDQILAVNGEDVKDAPRDHVIQLVRACEAQVSLLVCQPMAHCVMPGRKSTLLSAGKRAKLRSRPSRVRFAESVCVNGAPLFPVSKSGIYIYIYRYAFLPTPFLCSLQLSRWATFACHQWPMCSRCFWRMDRPSHLNMIPPPRYRMWLAHCWTSYACAVVNSSAWCWSMSRV